MLLLALMRKPLPLVPKSIEESTHVSEDGLIMTITKFSAVANFLSVVSNQGDMLSHFFQKEEKVAKEVYVNLQIVKPCIDIVAFVRLSFSKIVQPFIAEFTFIYNEPDLEQGL